MSKLVHTIFGFGAAALMSLSPLTAFAADTSLGVYQTTDRKMDYQLTLCGKDSKALCVKLAAARGTADTAQVHPYIGKLIVNQAKPTGKNKWAGNVNMQGYSGAGTLTLNPGKNFVMHGCLYIVLCQDFTLIPAKK